MPPGWPLTRIALSFSSISGPTHTCGSEGGAYPCARSRSSTRFFAISNAPGMVSDVAIPFWKNASPKNVASLRSSQPNEIRSGRAAVITIVWSSLSGSM